MWAASVFEYLFGADFGIAANVVGSAELIDADAQFAGYIVEIVAAFHLIVVSGSPYGCFLILAIVFFSGGSRCGLFVVMTFAENIEVTCHILIGKVEE